MEFNSLAKVDSENIAWSCRWQVGQSLTWGPNLPPRERGTRWCEVNRRDSLLQSSQTRGSTWCCGDRVSGELRRAKMLALLRHFQEAPSRNVNLPVVVFP